MDLIQYDVWNRLKLFGVSCSNGKSLVFCCFLDLPTNITKRSLRFLGRASLPRRAKQKRKIKGHLRMCQSTLHVMIGHPRCENRTCEFLAEDGQKPGMADMCETRKKDDWFYDRFISKLLFIQKSTFVWTQSPPVLFASHFFENTFLHICCQNMASSKRPPWMHPNLNCTASPCCDPGS